jgi:hypothetical protein
VTEEKRDPSHLSEELREYVEKAHKKGRESRPDENWRIKSPEKPPHIAPYKQDEEAAEADKQKEGAVSEDGIPHFDEGGQVDTSIPDSGMNDLLAKLQPAGAGTLSPSVNDSAALVPVPEPATKPVQVDTPIPAPATPKPAGPVPSWATPPEMTDQDFTNRASKMMGLDPTQQAAFLKMLGDKGQTAQIGAGIAGIGDAIASGGTLGKVNPGGMKAAEEMIQNKQKQGIEGEQLLRGNTKENFEMGQKLRGNAPYSPEVQKALVTQFHIPAGLASGPRDIVDRILPEKVKQSVAEAQLAYEQGTREDSKVATIAGRYNKPINDVQKSIDDVDSSIKGIQSGDLGQIASAQAIVSQALKLSPRLAKEAGGQSYAAKLNDWSNAKFGNNSMPPELVKPVIAVLNRQKQAYTQQKNNLIQQATAEGKAMRVDPTKIQGMFGTPGSPSSLGGQTPTATKTIGDKTYHKIGDNWFQE